MKAKKFIIRHNQFHGGDIISTHDKFWQAKNLIFTVCNFESGRGEGIKYFDGFRRLKPDVKNFTEDMLPLIDSKVNYPPWEKAEYRYWDAHGKFISIQNKIIALDTMEETEKAV